MTVAPMPCPFCGEPARVMPDTHNGLACVDCECEFTPGVFRDRIEDAIAAWNRRTTAELVCAKNTQTDATLHAIAEAVFLHKAWRPQYYDKPSTVERVKRSRAEAHRVVRLAADAPPPAREVTEEMVWAVCPFLRTIRGNDNTKCQRCPASIEDPDYGPCTQLCRAMAEEVVTAALAAGLEEKG